MITSTSIHYVDKVSFRRHTPSNSNCIQFVIETRHPYNVETESKSGEMEMVLFGLSDDDAKALANALQIVSPKVGTIIDRAEELAERVAQVISDTHDIDVTDDNYGVAVACDILGIDPDRVYSARRAAKEAEG
tara:strand:+ start:21502 stop:21900 length:399 start_codon:yes stop_codon:yes gene_type:complete